MGKMTQKSINKLLIFFSLLAVESYSRVDSSGMLFDPFSVHSYDVEFYVDNWEEQLKENYEYGIYLPAKLTYNEIEIDSIGVRYKGNSSYTESGASPKKPFKFKFDAFCEGQTFYGMSRLNFTNNVKDPSYMRETIAYTLARKYEPVPRTSYAKISLEGEYVGLYTQVEQIDSIFISRYSDSFNSSDGNLFKASSHGGTLAYKGVVQVDYYDEYEIQTNKVINDWSGFIDMIDFLNNSSDEDFLLKASRCLDLESCLRYLAFCQVFSHFDSYIGSSRNFYFYENSDDGRFTMLIWDLDRSFGGYSNGWDVYEADIVNISSSNNKPLTNRILENDSLKQVYLSYIDEMINGHCAPDSIIELADKYYSFLDSLVEDDPNSFMSYEAFQKSFYTDSTTFDRIPGIKDFTVNRYKALSDQLREYMEVPIITTIGGVSSEGAVKLNLNSLGGGSISVESSKDIGKGELKIYTPSGRIVQRIEITNLKKGITNIAVSISNISAGFYLVKLETNIFNIRQKLLIH